MSIQYAVVKGIRNNNAPLKMHPMTTGVRLVVLSEKRPIMGLDTIKETICTPMTIPICHALRWAICCMYCTKKEFDDAEHVILNRLNKCHNQRALVCCNLNPTLQHRLGFKLPLRRLTRRHFGFTQQEQRDDERGHSCDADRQVQRMVTVVCCELICLRPKTARRLFPRKLPS